MARALEGDQMRRDLTWEDALVLAIGATLAIVHHGLIMPWAWRLMEAGI